MKDFLQTFFFRFVKLLVLHFLFKSVQDPMMWVDRAFLLVLTLDLFYKNKRKNSSHQIASPDADAPDDFPKQFLFSSEVNLFKTTF